MKQPKTVQQLFAKEREDWLLACRSTARKLLQSRDEITIDDVTRINPRPSFIHPNATGNVFADPAFRCVRYTKSTRYAAHHRTIGVWTLTDEYLPDSFLAHKRRFMEGE